MDVAQVRLDLLAEQDSLDAVVADLTDEQWLLATPSPRWSVTDQIAHLAYFDNSAAVAITDPERFTASVSELFGEPMSPEASDELIMGRYRAMSGGELLEAWRADRATLAEASATLSDDDRVIWYGPSMGSKSFLTARLMEAWAHGQDILDTVGLSRESTDRLQHIARLGFITRGWTYANRGLEAPATPVSVSLTAPSGDVWNFGPDDAADTVSGTAEDFCLVVTQRRNVAQTGLQVTGDAAREWLEMAQAFAGPPTDGPPTDGPPTEGPDPVIGFASN